MLTLLAVHSISPHAGAFGYDLGACKAQAATRYRGKHAHALIHFMPASLNMHNVISYAGCNLQAASVLSVKLVIYLQALCCAS